MGSFDGNILIIQYENAKAFIFEKGCLVGEMNPMGNELRGYFVGYGRKSKAVVVGEAFAFDTKPPNK
jgi:hypothetical protein